MSGLGLSIKDSVLLSNKFNEQRALVYRQHAILSTFEMDLAIRETLGHNIS